ncbi:PBECR2 nuclease fold domain-containing protein [Pseudomonas oryzihabitans]|uniref:PBECR2 nuclease fold domain-containing protein n=1 Tax=Pseudomonas oryzihabitans TaxID=47885 RepID=UPI0011A923DB|nr:PBECR2 nuclease fold domain-containing protein [Pseudomonas oryzihabitans]
MSAETPRMMIREASGQQTWKEHGLPDLRSLTRELRALAPELVAPAATVDDAVECIATQFGFTGGVTSVDVTTPVGAVRILRDSLPHIVEKRADARERYVRYALDTLTGPFEVWKVLYTNDDYRLAFIGAYEAKNQMLVVVTVKDGLLLWNFMHSDARSMNKHRHGELLFRRYEIESKEKGQL